MSPHLVHHPAVAEENCHPQRNPVRGNVSRHREMGISRPRLYITRLLKEYLTQTHELCSVVNLQNRRH